MSSVRARFTSIDAPVILDEIYLIKRNALGQIPSLPENDKLSRVHQAILDHGFQYLSWVNSSDKSRQPSLETLRDIGFTPQYINALNFALNIHEEAGKQGIKWSTAFGPKGIILTMYIKVELM